jgi:hypothetical protein
MRYGSIFNYNASMRYSARAKTARKGTGEDFMSYSQKTARDEKACKGCGAAIFWTITTNGRRQPVNLDGTSHHATCPQGAEFHYHKRRAENGPARQLDLFGDTSLIRRFND